MENKTCGECRFYAKETEHCKLKGIGWKFVTDTPCSGFTPRKYLTIGDQIRQMSNTDLAEMLVYPVKPMNVNGNIHYEFTSCLLLGKSYPMREQAVFLTEKRLNAPADGTDTDVLTPAESEGEDE
jgi:hypothetical protein